MHLIINAENMFLPPTDSALYSIGIHDVLQNTNDLVNIVFAQGPVLFDPVHNLIVDIRLEVLEAQIIKIHLQPVQSQSMSQWGVDIHGLLSDKPLFHRALMLQSTHIMQSIGQLNQNDPYIFGHSQDHLANILCLSFFLGIEGDLTDLGHTVYNDGHIAVELL